MPKLRTSSAAVADQVVFMNIGWSDAYDGTKAPQGNFKYFGTEKARREGISEEDLFIPARGVYRGPLGRGNVDHVGRLDVVYTAIHKQDHERPRRIVAVFHDVKLEYQEDGDWWWASSRNVRLLRVADRPRLDYWPGRMGMRRWATGGFGTNHDELLRAYESLMSSRAGKPDATTRGSRRDGALHGQTMLLSLGESAINAGQYATRQVWRAGENAWRAAQVTRRPMPVLFSDASYSSRTIHYWARVRSLDISSTGSQISWSDVRSISGHQVDELIKVSDGRPVDAGGGRYFLMVETPDFLQNAGGETSRPEAVAPTGNTTQDTGRAVTLEDAEHDPLAYEQVQRRLRHHQSAFRSNLLTVYGHRCAVTGADVPAALQAAHIDPHSKTADNRTDNGLLLRADLHALFDMGLLRVSPVSLRIDLHPSLRQSTYADLQGQQLRAREDDGRPNDDALHARWNASVETPRDSSRSRCP